MKGIAIVAWLSGLLFIVQSASSAEAKKTTLTKIKSYTTSDSLPPELNVTFDLACNEKFVKVVRHETSNKLLDFVTINLGVLIEQDSNVTCKTAPKQMTVSAGKTFSGRKYDVSLIHVQTPQLTVREN